jgi:hypothetical protein
MREIPATVQTTYQNLLDAHRNMPAFDIEGSPFKRVLNGKGYWYANERPSGDVAPVQRYLGPDTEDMRARIQAMQDQKTDRRAWTAACSQMVAQIRAGGIQGLDRRTGTALRGLARSGVFRLGGTLVGTNAYRHFDFELGIQLSGPDPGDRKLTETHDLDIARFEALSSTISDHADPDIAETLTALGYTQAITLRGIQPTSWRNPSTQYVIDFLTPSFEETEGPRHLAALNVWAHSFHFLNYLIKDPIPAVSIYMEGLLVQVPQPARYAVHKLIVSQRRPVGSGVKARKDVQQARSIFAALSPDQEAIVREAIQEADAMGPKWRKALDKALQLRIEPSDPVVPGDCVEYRGRGLEGPVRLRVSGTALRLLDIRAGLNDQVRDMPETAKHHQPTIEALFQKKFRQCPSPDVLLRSDDIPDRP